jgi:hypothetical protein
MIVRSLPACACSVRPDACAQICLGPVCVPIGAFVPALIVLAHQRGWLLWINPGWFDWKWYRLQYRRCACCVRGAFV